MGFFGNLFTAILAIGVAAMLYFTIKNNGELFTKEKLGKSFSTMGFLALALIAVIAVVVMLLRG